MSDAYLREIIKV